MKSSIVSSFRIISGDNFSTSIAKKILTFPQALVLCLVAALSCIALTTASPVFLLDNGFDHPAMAEHPLFVNFR